MSADLILALSREFPAERLYTDPVDCYAYAYDNSRNYHAPIAVIFR